MTQHVTIVGRGHSGTRAIAATLRASGYHMGKSNPYNDLIPAQPMYDAVREASKRVKRVGEYHWDFTRLINSKPSKFYMDKVSEYLSSLDGNDPIAWKLPESVLALPWLIRMYPDAYYIHWVRDGRDNILTEHGSEHFAEFGIPATTQPNRLYNAAVSWKYHEDLIEATPKPANWITVRLCDFVREQDATLKRLGEFLGRDLHKIPVFHDVIGRWQRQAEAVQPVVPIMQRQLERHQFV